MALAGCGAFASESAEFSVPPECELDFASFLIWAVILRHVSASVVWKGMEDLAGIPQGETNLLFANCCARELFTLRIQEMQSLL